MKKHLLQVAFFSLIAAAPASAQCSFTVTDSITHVTCFGGNNGAVSVNVTGGTPMQTSTRPLLLSEVHANPTGTDSPFEFVELLATRNIDFSVTPYTVIFSNNGTANANGWVAGAALTYAFQISTGTVTVGDVIYVGGSSMIPTTNVFRSINNSNTAGDGGIGNASASGNLGNGGANADGVAVFSGGTASLTSASVPIDAIFWGTAAGNAVVSAGTAGYELPVNDTYTGGKLQTTSYIGPDQNSVVFLTATGSYDIQTNTFTTPRVWTNSNTFTNLSSAISLSGLYNYSWSPVSATGSSISGLTAGTYTLSVTDGTPCTQNFTYTVNQASDIVANISVTNASCVCDGALSATVTGGTGSVYSYAWSGGCTSSSCSSVCAGPYSLIVTDSVGCVDTSNATVASSSVQLAFNTTSACSTYTDCIVVSGGSSPYTFAWSNGATTQCITVATPGIYCVQVSDMNGCTASICDTVTSNMIFNVPQPNLGNDTVVCPPMNITFNAGNYASYLWQDGSTNPTFTFVSSNAFFPDTVFVTVTDSNGCTGSDTVFVDICVGMDEMFAQQMNVYADASGNLVYVQSEKNTDARIEMFDINGRLATAMQTMHGKSATLNVSSLREGIYLVRIVSDEGYATQHKILLRRN